MVVLVANRTIVSEEEREEVLIDSTANPSEEERGESQVESTAYRDLELDVTALQVESRNLSTILIDKEQSTCTSMSNQEDEEIKQHARAQNQHNNSNSQAVEDLVASCLARAL